VTTGHVSRGEGSAKSARARRTGRSSPGTGKERAAASVDGAGPGPVDPIEQALEQWPVERPDLDPSPMAVFGRIARVHAMQRTAQAGVHGPLGLSYPAFDILANLRRSGAPYRKTATALSESSMITTGGMTMRLDALEKSQLIRRVRDDADRRVVRAELTAAGLHLIDQAIGAHLAMEHAVLEALTPEERETLAVLLRTLETALTKHNESAR
jgi:DNA-binding MarR family transcriptional regulator